MKNVYMPCAYYNGKIIYKSSNGYRIKNTYTIYPSIDNAKSAIGRVYDGRKAYEF